MSVEAPWPLSDLPFTRAWSETWPRLSRPGVTDWMVRLPTSTGRPTISLTAAKVAAMGPSPDAVAWRSPVQDPVIRTSAEAPTVPHVTWRWVM